jgi:hypothetical protein
MGGHTEEVSIRLLVSRGEPQDTARTLMTSFLGSLL